MIRKPPKRTQAMIAASDGKRPDPTEWRPAPAPNTREFVKDLRVAAAAAA